jgi:hypothetical protein
MKKLRAISPGRWVGGVVLGLLVLAIHLPNCIVVVRDAHGQSSGQTRYAPFATGWTIGYVTIGVCCVLFGGRIATGIGIVMLLGGLLSG